MNITPSSARGCMRVENCATLIPSAATFCYTKLTGVMNMNKQLQDYARNELKEGLAMLPEKQQLFFKRMYSHQNLDANINDVVDSMPEEKLDWAMQQVQRSLDKATV